MSKIEFNNQKLYNIYNTKIIIEKSKTSLYYSSIYKKYLIYFLIVSKFDIIFCEDDKKGIKSLILLILLGIVLIIVITLIIIFIVKCCKRRIEQNRNNFFEGTNYLERDNPEEKQLRERISNSYPKALSDYLKEKLISDIYSKKFELLETQCSICLENFEENKSVIIIGGCLHIFHQKCLSELAEKIDINKSIIAQFICPSCRNNLFSDIDKLNLCVKKFPNFFDDMFKNKKLTKIKHVKNLINSINEGKYFNLKDNCNTNIRINLKIKEDNKDETDRNSIKEENNDISYDNKIITKKNLQSHLKNKTENENNIIKNNINNENNL